MSCRVRFGFDANSLAACFGVRPDRLDRWVRDGLLKPASDGRFSEVAIARFIREYPQEYDLARVDQMWFKAMVFAVGRTDAGSAENSGSPTVWREA